MSASLWDLVPASAGALLTNEECYELLDTNIFDYHEEDLLRSCCPTATTKTEYDNLQLQDDVSTSLYPPSPQESKPSPAELANDLLQQLDNQCKQENIFSNWLEEKVELPIFENIAQVPERVELYPAPPAQQPTDELIREFETVFYGVGELTHLTPPQSPPGPATQLLLSYAQQAQCTATAAPAPALAPAPVPLLEQWACESLPLGEYACGVDAVDELVRRSAAQLATPLGSPQGSAQGSGSASPRSTPPSSPRSSTDDEWPSTSRPKPYSRNLDDRRSRKKEQNKNAATRYRQKKKAEIEVLLSEEETMRQRNCELGDKCSDLQREIRYLKGLMRDLFKAKGLIK